MGMGFLMWGSFTMLVLVIILLEILRFIGISDTDMIISIQVIGFLILIPKITMTLTKFIIYLSKNRDKRDEFFYKSVLQSFAIILVVLGLLLQTEFFKNIGQFFV